jgi:carboxypeptidase C (cathepsin A)
MMNRLRIGWIVLFVLLAAGMARAAPPPGHPPSEKPEAREATREAEPPRVPVAENIATTSHSATIGSTRIDYTVRTGTLVLKEETGKPRASIFFIAYTRDKVADPGRRPLTLAFNGGPGSSSVWLHLGALGPRRVELADGELATQNPPFALVNNDHSILDFTDLVFIDPVSTGYSRAVSREEARKFHGVREDIEAVGDFIRLYVTRTQRWLSPKFLIGESYGSTRAAGLVDHLQERHGMYLNGLVLVSVVLNFQTISFDQGNDLPYILFLPAYTAAAWHHRQLPAELQRQELNTVLTKAERFAREEYAPALLAGASLPEATRKEVVTALASLTGVSPRYIEQNNLRLPMSRFAKELLRERQLLLGRFDSRFTGPVRKAAGEFPAYDPSYTAVKGIFTATFNDYVRTALGFEKDLPYEILNSARVQPWNFGEYENRYLDVTGELQAAMLRQPGLKVLFANGYFDLATPYAATGYTIDHLELPPDVRRNVVAAYYPAGHMMYLHEPSLAKFRQDLLAFFQAAR